MLKVGDIVRSSIPSGKYEYYIIAGCSYMYKDDSIEDTINGATIEDLMLCIDYYGHPIGRYCKETDNVEFFAEKAMQKPIIAFVLVTEKYSVKVGHISNYDAYLTKNMLMNKSFNYQFMSYKEIEGLIHKNYKAVHKMNLCEPLARISKKEQIEMLTMYITRNLYSYYYLVPFALCTVFDFDNRVLCLSFKYKLDTEYTVNDSALSEKYGVAAMYRDLKTGITMSGHEFHPYSENALIDKILLYKTELKLEPDFFKPLELEMREYLNNGIRIVKDYTKCLK